MKRRLTFSHLPLAVHAFREGLPILEDEEAISSERHTAYFIRLYAKPARKNACATWKWQAHGSLWSGQAKACPTYGAHGLGEGRFSLPFVSPR